MRVTYVLGHPTLGGGTKVVAQHASLLQQAGEDVTIVAQGPRPNWLPFAGRYVDASETPPRLPSQDVVIATFWTTLETATGSAIGRVAHFCQGYEGRLGYLRTQWPSIEAAYAARVPTLAVTPDLAAFLGQRFGRTCRVTPPVVDPVFRPLHYAGFPPLAWSRPRPRRVPWIAISGLFEADVKDIPTALDAVARLRSDGRRCHVLRVSSLPLPAGERERPAPDRLLCAEPPVVVARALRACDLAFFTSRPEEGFGLPLLEAMASGVPAIATDIPSVSYMTRGAVPLVPAGDAQAFAEAAGALLGDAARWRQVRRDAYDASRRFEPELVLPELLSAVRWAAAYDPDHDGDPDREAESAPETDAGRKMT